MKPTVKFTPSHPSAPWRVYYRGRSYWRLTESDAQQKARDLASGNRRATFTDRELDQFRQAQEILGGVPLLTAVRAYAERNETTLTLADAMARHMARECGGRRPAYVAAKKYNLAKLTAALGSKQLGAITQEHLMTARDALGTPNTRNAFLSHARVFFNWAVTFNLTKNNPSDGIQTEQTEASKVILSLDDTAHLLDTCRKHFPKYLPAVALQLFCGIRTFEICRLEWSSVKPGAIVDIPKEASKTHERRVIDWWPARLTEFIPKALAGPIVKRSAGADNSRVYEKAKGRLMAKCAKLRPDFVTGQNSLRHSFASYAVGYWQDASKVSLWMGHHDAHLLFRHYRSYRTKEEGAAYFGITAQPAP